MFPGRETTFPFTNELGIFLAESLLIAYASVGTRLTLQPVTHLVALDGAWLVMWVINPAVPITGKAWPVDVFGSEPIAFSECFERCIGPLWFLALMHLMKRHDGWVLL